MPHTAKPLVICYSRQGHSRRVAEMLLSGTGAELRTLQTERYRTSLLWVARAIWDVMKAREVPLEGFPQTDLAGRPWIVVCGPVWANRPAAPVREALSRLRGHAMPVGVLLTYGGSSKRSGIESAITEALGRRADAMCLVTNAEEGQPGTIRRLVTFADQLAGAAENSAA
jgi:hypothetical protein